MIDKQTAATLALEAVKNNEYLRQQQDEFVIIDAATIENGWIFILNSRKYLETKEHKYLLYGVPPMVVEREGGSVHFLASVPPLEERIKEYEAQRASS